MNRIGLALLLVVCTQTLQAADEPPLLPIPSPTSPGQRALQAADEPPLLPTTPPPKVAIAKATDNAGRVMIALTTQRMVKESRVRLVPVNGKNVEETYEAEKLVCETQEVETDGSAKVFDRNGVVVDPRTLPLLLKKDTPVLLTPDGKLDRFYRQLYRDEILVIAWQEPKGAPAVFRAAPVPAIPAAK